jgi:hypothetical protein
MVVQQPVRHTIVTFIAPVIPGHVPALETLLIQIADLPDKNQLVPFGTVPRLHFACFVILPKDDPFDPCLVFECNFDGQLEAFLDDLPGCVGSGLHSIYAHCVGYNGSVPYDRAALRRYLLAHVVRPAAYHIGNVGRSLERIRQETELRAGIEGYLDTLVPGGIVGKSPADVRQGIQDFVRQCDPFPAVGSRQSLPDRILPWAKIVGTGLVALVLSPVLLVWAGVLRFKEWRDPVQADPPKHTHVQALLDREDRTPVVQNHMASITRVKPGPFRRMTLRVVLRVANLVARISTKGELSGIPSIHFAHWSMINNGHRLLFLTNYDGSWENYLDDFIDKASSGLTAIWGNTVGFPRTWFLVRGGSRDGARFKAIARDKQIYTNAWYSAYPDLTVQSIDSNSAIREDLWRELDDSQVSAWLRRF